MMSDEYLVECKIDDDDDYEEEVMRIHPTPTPPPQFCSSSQVSVSHGETRDPYGVNHHLRPLRRVSVAGFVNAFLPPQQVFRTPSNAKLAICFANWLTRLKLLRS
ncbi:hypothetical protein HF521_006143 [Silurus meridionalis]|uniref:Uncharacterized protein n=1 Tax=Silurus meridionalis TaxID=175797 RepID=A0A8T0AXN8_SILME|nr:hypothetical protein HF521_006143 [Silurus meridionalis]